MIEQRDRRATKVLTIWQPWAWLIAEGIKDVENRGWSTSYRGKMLIHVGLRWRRAEVEAWLDELVGSGLLGERVRPSLDELHRQRGHVIALVDLVGCRHSDKHSSPWAVPGGFVLELANVVRLDSPIPMTGKQSLVVAPAEAVEQVEAQIGGRR